MRRGAHMWICGAMVVVALVFVFATGSGASLLPGVGCVLMMGAMMWMMRGTNGHVGGKGSPRVRPSEHEAHHG